MAGGDATTLPLPDAGRPSAAGRFRNLRLPRAGADVEDRRLPRAAAICMAGTVVLCLMIVLAAANRPTLLSPTTHYGFFPRWMAGPLGGLLPWLPENADDLKIFFSAAVALMYVGYLIVLPRAGRIPARWMIATVVAIHLVFILSPPLTLTDIFNYINYGRMEIVNHLNPYTTIPILEPHTDPSYALSNWHELLSPYGPLFTMITFLVVPLGVAGSFWALKVLLSLTSLAILLLVWRCARLLGREPVGAIAFVGLNPVVLVWGLGGDHNDFLMMFCILLGFYLLLRSRLAHSQDRNGGPPAHGRLASLICGRELAAGAAFVAAAGLKASGAVLIPVVLAGLLRDRRAFIQVLAGMILGGIVLGLLSLVAFGLHIPDLSTQSKLVAAESVPNLIGMAIGQGGQSETLRHVMTGLLLLGVGACCWLAYRRSRPGGTGPESVTAAGWSSLVLLVTLAWVLPWYVLWVLPLAALTTSVRLRRLSLAFGVYLILIWVPVSGSILHAVGFYPERTALGRLHGRYTRQLINF